MKMSELYDKNFLIKYVMKKYNLSQNKAEISIDKFLDMENRRVLEVKKVIDDTFEEILYDKMKKIDEKDNEVER